VRILTLKLVFVFLMATASSLCGGIYLPSMSDFANCPAVGLSPACAFLFIINPFSTAIGDYDVRGYAMTMNGNPTVGPYDGSDDSLIGVLNMSGVTIPSLSMGVLSPGVGVTGQPIFAFDGDGICGFGITPQPAGCPCGATGYEGPGTTFTYINNNSLSFDPGGGMRSGTVGFNNGLADGAFVYFSLEDLFKITGCVENCGPAPAAVSGSAALFSSASSIQISSISIQPSVVNTAQDAAIPEPGSMGLTLIGIAAVAFRSRRAWAK
jgi:hypothetical protein